MTGLDKLKYADEMYENIKQEVLIMHIKMLYSYMSENEIESAFKDAEMKILSSTNRAKLEDIIRYGILKELN